MSNPDIVQVTAIICKHMDELEEASNKYDEIESSGYAYSIKDTIQRKQYAISAQKELLRTILAEIGSEVSA